MISEADFLEWLAKPQTGTDITRRLCELEFHFFVRQAWPVIESAPFVDNWHVRMMCEHLQAVHEGRVARLLLNVPPGTSKSIISTVMWPAWRWALNPALRFLCASYSTGLAVKHAVICRNLIYSDWYQSLWGRKVRLSEDQNQKVYYETTAGGFRLGTNPKGRATGEHPHVVICFPRETTVWTTEGHLPIGDIVERRMAVAVPTLNVRTGRMEVRPVVGWHRNPPGHIVEVRLDNGGRFRCTADHRVWTANRGWVAAVELAATDTLPSPTGGEGETTAWTLRHRRPVSVVHCGTSTVTYCITVRSTNTFCVGDDRTVVSNCDDPHTVGRAESAVERQAVLDWWDETISTRGAVLKAAHVVVMQRLNEADLSGHVLRRGGYVHIKLPMEWEEESTPTPVLDSATGRPWRDYRDDPEYREAHGRLLWPEMFDQGAVDELKRALGPYAAAGQLQQRPAPRGGSMFRREDFRVIARDLLPLEYDALVRFWDKAGTQGGGAWTVGTLMGRKGAKVYVIDVKREQLSAGRVEELIASTATLDDERYGLAVETWVEQEPGSGGQFQADFTMQRLRGLRVKAEPAKGSKAQRAEPWATCVENREAYVAAAPWTETFLEEHAQFPRGEFKDQVDSASGAYRKVIRPERTAVDPADLQACLLLAGPGTAAHPYRQTVAAVFSTPDQSGAGFVVLGVDAARGRFGLLEATVWDALRYERQRVPPAEVAAHIVARCAELRVPAVVGVPGHTDHVAMEIPFGRPPLAQWPLHAANRLKFASTLIAELKSRSVELYDCPPLFAELVQLPLRIGVEGYALEGIASGSGPLCLGVAFGVALVWARGTYLDTLAHGGV